MAIECGHQVIFNFGGRDSCMLCKADLTPAGSEEPTRPADDHDKVLDALHNKFADKYRVPLLIWLRRLESNEQVQESERRQAQEGPVQG